MKCLTYWLTALGVISVILLSSHPVLIQANGDSVETNGSIEFYGVYIFENEPDPEPPGDPDSMGTPSEDSLENGDRDLPQANQLQFQSYYLLLGLLLIAVAYQEMRYQRQKRLLSNGKYSN